MGSPDELDPHPVGTTAATASGDAAPVLRPAFTGTVGRYVIDGVLGAGAMGTVYNARDTVLNRHVALKAIRVGSDPRPAARVVREAQAIARVSHPGVIHVYDVGEADGLVYIAMERVDGPTLEQWLRDEERSPRAILDVFLAAGHGLAAAHAAGLVHRDFKPENVMVGRDGRLRVLDFGLARPEDGDHVEIEPGVPTSGEPVRAGTMLTATGALVGTPAFMSPEQWRAERTDARSDQFSFSVALHIALTGQHPFDTTSRKALRESVLAGRSTLSPLLPARLRDVIARGLAPRSDDRFPAMPDLLAALAPARHRGRWIAAGVVAAIALGLAAWALARREPVTPPAAAPADPARQMYRVARQLTARGDVVDAALAPDGDRVAFVTGDSLIVQDLTSDSAPRVLLRGDIGPSSSIAWSPDGARIAVNASVAGADARLVTVDVATGAVRTLREPFGMIALLPDGIVATAKYWTSSTITFYAEAAATTPLRTCEIPGPVRTINDLRYDAASDAIFVGRQGDRGWTTILRTDRNCRSVQPVTGALDLNEYAVVDGGIWVHHRDSGDLLEIGAGGWPTGRRHTLPNRNNQIVGVRRDRSVVHTSGTSDWRLLERGPDGATRELGHGPSKAFVSISPDGAWMAAIDSGDHRGELRLLRVADPTAEAPLISDHAQTADWSPDGTRLLVRVRRDKETDSKGSEIKILDPATGTMTPVAVVDWVWGGPATWLDDHRVAMYSTGTCNTRWIDVRTGEQGDSIPGIPCHVYLLARSHVDGTLAFVPGPERIDSWLWTVRPGEKPRRLARLPAHVDSLSGRELQWSPDGRSLIWYKLGGEMWRFDATSGAVTPLPPVELPPAADSLLFLVAPRADRTLVYTMHDRADLYLSAPVP